MNFPRRAKDGHTRFRGGGAALAFWLLLGRLLAGGGREGQSELVRTAEEIERTTAEILSRPEFGASASRGGWAVAMEALESWLAAAARVLHADSTSLAWLILIVAVLLAGYAVSVLLGDLGGGFSLPTLGKPNKSPDPWRALEGTAAGWDEALQRARGALAAGRVYEALWIAHRAFLGLLDQRGLVDFARWKTNLDYLGECPSDESIYPLFEAVSQAYDEVVYGHRPLPAGGVGELLRRLEEAGRDEAVH